jgi:hypothetical protein
VTRPGWIAPGENGGFREPFTEEANNPTWEWSRITAKLNGCTYLGGAYSRKLGDERQHNESDRKWVL